MPRRDTAEIVARRQKVGETIREIRQAKAMSQEEAAERAGVSPQVWSHYELGRRTPDLLWLPSLADALGVTVLALSRKIWEKISTQC